MTTAAAPRSPIAIVGFDLDGTLVDTGDEIAAAANAALRDLGLPTFDRDAIVRHVGHGGRELMRRLLDDAGADRRESDVDAAHGRFDARYGEVAGTLSAPYPGCVDALARLLDGGLRLACLTNKKQSFAEQVLDACGIAGHFSIVVGGDTLAVKKPDRGVVDHVLRWLGGEREAMVHVGDSRTDVETARNAGIAAWAVPWGYNGGEPVAAARPDRLFASFAEIADAVLGAGGRDPSLRSG